MPCIAESHGDRFHRCRDCERLVLTKCSFLPTGLAERSIYSRHISFFRRMTEHPAISAGPLVNFVDLGLAEFSLGVNHRIPARRHNTVADYRSNLGEHKALFTVLICLPAGEV